MATIPETRRLADQLERAVRGGAWHGPALLENLDGVDADAARRKPGAGAHSIWEIAAHVSTWIEICRQRIEGRTETDPSPDDDWPPVPTDADDAAWRELVSTLEERHRRLHATLLALDDARLDDPVAGSDPTVRGMVLGLLQHHAYHGGQVALLRRAG